MDSALKKDEKYYAQVLLKECKNIEKKLIRHITDLTICFTTTSICWHNIIVKFFDVVVFLLSSLVTGPSFASIPLLVLELGLFLFIRDWRPGFWKSEIHPSGFLPKLGDWDELMSLSVYFTVSLCLGLNLIVTKLLMKKRCIFIKAEAITWRFYPNLWKSRCKTIKEILKGCLSYKPIFCHEVVLDIFMNFFIWRKNNVFVFEIFRFLYFCKIHKFQNLWRRHRHCYIMEVMLIFFNS